MADRLRAGVGDRVMRVGVGLIAACAMGTTGCHSKATAHDGRFTFAYAATVEPENFVKPIAPGAKLEVLAFANGTEDALVITAARSTRPEIIAVRSVRERSVVVEGGVPGVAEIEVTARDAAGSELVDRMFFHVARPTTHRLQHGCTDASEAAYVRGEDVIIHHELATGDRRPVIGFEHAPVVVAPGGALELVQEPQAGGYYVFRAPAAQPGVTLRSRVDDQALTLRIVERASLTDVALLAPERMLEGESAYAVATVRAGDLTLCNQNALTRARSLTPDVCKVTAQLDEEPDQDANREQLARVTALAFGVCKLEVTLPELAGGRGAVLAGEIKVGREEYPEERSVGRALFGAWRPPVLAYVARDALAAVVCGVWWLLRRRRNARAP